MCGIAGIHRRTDSRIEGIGRLADGLLLSLVHRGSDATGVATVNDRGKVHVQKLVRPASEFVLVRELFPADARTVLLHTRFATRGRADDPNNAHPVRAGKCLAVHNGTIYNDRELFARHGMRRTAEVDSIVIPALVNKLGWDQAEKALAQLSGGAATAVVHRDRPREVLLARTETYPLHVYVTDDTVVWASEPQAIKLAWRYAFREIPDGGEWLTVPERTLIRVNGRLSWSKLPGGKPKPRASKGDRRRARVKPRKQQQLRLAAAPPPVDPYGVEGWMEDEVRDLMRWSNLDYESAYEAVMGCSPGPDLDWTDDILEGDIR